MSEIKATDLRMGNLFLYENCIYIAKIIRDNYVYGINKNGFAPGEFPIGAIKPIPLTSEILLACGFEEVEYESDGFYNVEYHLKVNEDIFIAYSTDFSCCVWSNKRCMEEFGVIPKWENVKYLHGLQNLVHILSGQELEFKPELK
jgi:hypothetical protein